MLRFAYAPAGTGRGVLFVKSIYMWYNMQVPKTRMEVHNAYPDSCRQLEDA